MLTQVDEYGYILNLMEGIISYNKDDTDESKEDLYVVTNHRRMLPRKATSGWNHLVQWKYKSESWIHLK